MARRWRKRAAACIAGSRMVEFACGVPSLLMGDTLENIARGVDCETMRQPLGVCVGITPFNFPAMVPLWMYPARARLRKYLRPEAEREGAADRGHASSSCSRKPACRKACSISCTADAKCVDALLTHPKVKAISFVGSTPIARYIYETGTQPRQTRAGERRREELTSSSCRMPMCDKSVRGVVEAAFGCAGERCMAGSTAVTVGAAAERRSALARRSRARDQSRPDRSRRAAGHGPGHHRASIAIACWSSIASGEKEGAKVIADGRGVNVADAPNGFFLGATIVDQVQTGMTIAREEIFGPVLNVMRMDDLDAAIELANRSAYGNGAAIFTHSGKAAREFKHRVKAGMVGINVGVPATMAMVPVHRLGRIFFGDLHIQGTRRRAVLHAAKSHDHALVWRRRRRRLEENNATCHSSSRTAKSSPAERTLRGGHLLRRRNDHAHRPQASTAPAGRGGDRREREVCLPRIHRSARAHLPAVHGHVLRRTLRHGQPGGARRRDDDAHRDVLPGARR